LSTPKLWDSRLASHRTVKKQYSSSSRTALTLASELGWVTARCRSIKLSYPKLAQTLPLTRPIEILTHSASLSKLSEHHITMLSSIVFALALSGSNVAFAATSTSYATRPAISTIQPSLASIYAAQATATSLSPVSDVKGQAFDRIIQIWLENTVSHTRVIFRSQSLILIFRTLTKLLQTQICNGLQVKEFSLPTTSLQPTLPSRKFIWQNDKVLGQG
jgi:hypothetical protein